jgi:hypothetical protein
MTDARDDRTRSMDQASAGEDEEGQLTRQTPGLDAGVTDAIAGPDWDPELVDDAKTSVEGEPLDGEVERGPSAGATATAPDATGADSGAATGDPSASS